MISKNDLIQNEIEKMNLPLFDMSKEKKEDELTQNRNQNIWQEDQKSLQNEVQIEKKEEINVQSNLRKEVEENLPPSISNEQVNRLAGNEQVVRQRLAVEENMPEKHLSILKAQEKLDAQSKLFGDSSAMKAVRAQTQDLIAKLSETALYPCEDKEFETNLATVEKSYEQLIAACMTYVQHAGKPLFKKGKRRLAIVNDILAQARAEYGRITFSAEKLRQSALSEDKQTPVLFSDVIGHTLVKDMSAETGAWAHIDAASQSRVAVSRIAEIFQAKDAIQSAKQATYMKADGTIKDYICIADTATETKSLADLIAENPQTEIAYAPEANRQIQTVRLMDALLGHEPRKESEYRCRYTEITENNVRKLRIDKVIADNKGLGDAPGAEAAQNVAALIQEWKSAPDQGLVEGLNKLLSMDPQSMALSFGDLMSAQNVSVLAERFATVRKELSKSGLAKELGIFEYKSENDIVVTQLTQKELLSFTKENRRAQEKQRLVNEADRIRKRLGNLSPEDPLGALLADIEAYGNMHVTATSVIKDSKTVSVADEENLLKEILRKADELKATYGTDPQYAERLSLINGLMDPVTKNVNGLLEGGTDEKTEYIIEQPQAEPLSALGSGAKWKDRKDALLFAHEPNINDVRQGGIGDCFFMAAISALVSADPDYVKKMMRDNGDGTVTVRLFQFVQGAFSPVFVKVRKTIPMDYKGDRDLYAGDCLWVQMLEKAFVCSGLTNGLRTIANVRESLEEFTSGLDDPKFRERVGDVKGFESNKKLKKKGQTQEAGAYQSLVGGYAEDALALLCGNTMTQVDSKSLNMYWGDFRYKSMNAESRQKLETQSKYTNFFRLDQRSETYLYEMMNEHDEKKADQIRQNNEKIVRDNAEIDALPEAERKKKKKKKPREIPRKRDQKITAADSKELNRARYYMVTGKKKDPNADEAGKKQETNQIRFTTAFIAEFLKYMDQKAPLSVKDRRPSDLYAKLMREYLEGFVEKGKDESERNNRREFLLSEDCKAAQKWLQKQLKNPESDDQARYTLYSGNYYGSALKVFDEIKAGEQAGKAMVTGGGARFRIINGGGDDAESNVEGLYGGHAYTILGATERTIGGKTYKFIAIRNPWGSTGTEYHYDPKKKMLTRKEIKGTKLKETEGVSLVELSEFMMMFDGTNISNNGNNAPGR